MDGPTVSVAQQVMVSLELEPIGNHELKEQRAERLEIICLIWVYFALLFCMISLFVSIPIFLFFSSRFVFFFHVPVGTKSPLPPYDTVIED